MVTLSHQWNEADLLTILDMIYGGSFELNQDNVFDVLYLADYLLVEHVTAICLEYIKSHLTIEQALELWKVAKRSANAPLIKIAKEFSLRKFSKLVKNRNSGLYDLNSKQLLSIIRQDDLKIRNERTILDCVYDWAVSGQTRESGSRFEDPNFCKLVWQGVRLGRLTRNPTCNCCSFATNRVADSCKCFDIGKVCPLHEPSFEDYPMLNTHVQSCSDCKNSLERLSNQQTFQEFPTNAWKQDPVSSMWYKPRTSYETVVAVGGWNDNSPTATMQIYNPQANSWIKIAGDERSARAYHGLVELNGLLYCVGGFNGTERLNTLLCLDNKTLQWIEKSPMHEKRCYVSVVSLKGFIYAIGGHDGTTRLKTVERFISGLQNLPAASAIMATFTNNWPRAPR